MYPFASNQKYGMTVCAPIMDENNAFTGAFCQDLLPTLNYGNSSSQNFDNYLGNMYMSLDKINYILFDKDLFWKQNYTGFKDNINDIFRYKAIKDIGVVDNSYIGD